MKHISEHLGIAMSITEPGVEFISRLRSSKPIGSLKRRDKTFLIHNQQEIAITKEQYKFLKEIVTLTSLLFGDQNVEEFIKKVCSCKEFAKTLTSLNFDPIHITENAIKTTFRSEEE